MRNFFSKAAEAVSTFVHGTPSERAYMRYESACDRAKKDGRDPDKDKECRRLESEYERLSRRESESKPAPRKPA
ncbi:MAG: hypothetical protein DI626_03280 [Micavibrio aeruginosavorus]|uniref:Uncharacterized protein n=1 Tax=Micavibrio aeruginosavorus TaxID=349221 RepID=A0A2W5C1B6_9BACT|nr:MAG: hypothetical protein DI626_03280 [Micavibrio aeruginosavorus]